MRAFILLGLATISLSSWAQLGNSNNISNAVTNAIVASIHSIKKDNASADTVSGLCEFHGSSCNGAQVSLFLENKEIYTTVLTGSGKFDIPKLKPRQSYLLKLSWPKYKVDKSRTVEAGQFITINLSN